MSLWLHIIVSMESERSWCYLPNVRAECDVIISILDGSIKGHSDIGVVYSAGRHQLSERVIQAYA